MKNLFIIPLFNYYFVIPDHVSQPGSTYFSPCLGSTFPPPHHHDHGFHGTHGEGAHGPNGHGSRVPHGQGSYGSHAHVMDLMGYEGECRRRTEVIEWLLFFQANRSLTL